MIPEADHVEEPRGWSVRRILAVAMIVVLVLISIFVVVKIAKDGSTKSPHHAAPAVSVPRVRPA